MKPFISEESAEGILFPSFFKASLQVNGNIKHSQQKGRTINETFNESPGFYNRGNGAVIFSRQ